MVHARVRAALDVGQAQAEAAATALYRARTNARKPQQVLRHPLVALRWYSGHAWCLVVGAAAVGAAWATVLLWR